MPDNGNKPTTRRDPWPIGDAVLHVAIPNSVSGALQVRYKGKKRAALDRLKTDIEASMFGDSTPDYVQVLGDEIDNAKKAEEVAALEGVSDDVLAAAVSDEALEAELKRRKAKTTPPRKRPTPKGRPS